MCFPRSDRQSHSFGLRALRNTSFLSCAAYLESRTNWRALGKKRRRFLGSGPIWIVYWQGGRKTVEAALCSTSTCSPASPIRRKARSFGPPNDWPVKHWMGEATGRPLLKCWVEASELDPDVGRGELPLDYEALLVPLLFPRRHLPPQLPTRPDSAIQALPVGR